MNKKINKLTLSGTFPLLPASSSLALFATVVASSLIAVYRLLTLQFKARVF
jgi:hypothetical protein